MKLCIKVSEVVGDSRNNQRFISLRWTVAHYLGVLFYFRKGDFVAASLLLNII
jgi:hypothetical protein